ncbi:MAG: DEAD/DEAH box helicase family protein [Acidobacteria bacterium]|uniref:DEAD/DEAH box helicase family protein n=1 Tax=Candidatus Polarisedimenticola svalbardensis TaxID=2886004 RepID=A0A8J7CE04_9BACT|nr:DEAD/DEAH box helicase family protein [Candidatus Polarisedimenticola svalbardensis]
MAPRDPRLEALMNHRVIHRYNPELGPGKVRIVEDRTLVVEFPRTGTVLRLAMDSETLRPLVIPAGCRAIHEPSGEEVTVEATLPESRVRLLDGREMPEEELWPLDNDDSLVERLSRGDVDKVEDFALLMDALHLATIREADGLGSYLGGRIELFPHQLFAAEQASRTDPVRWLLADEVGLGKTVEACLILNRLVRTRRAERTLVIAPETLTVQWLGELWRKYHQVFVLLDDQRLADVEKEYGKGFNPFDAYGQVVLGMEMLVDNPQLSRYAVEAGIDLLIVDEAHHLRRPAGHPGNPAYRLVRPISDLGRHVLLLTATPMEEDAHGFFRLLQILRPEEFPEELGFQDRLDARKPLPACTSATRRVDIGGLPPRVGRPVEVEETGDWSPLLDLEKEMCGREAEGPVHRGRKLRRIQRALSCGAALKEILEPGDETGRRLSDRAVRKDPRLEWLGMQAREWRNAGDKTLVFVKHRESLEVIRSEMSRRAQIRVGLFHEDLSPARRDIEVAQFRLNDGPSMLVCTECGGEGRNFQFCTRVVLFDLPWDPMAVEQRIGRLDRIGRTIPVEIVYFRPPAGLGRSVAGLYETLGLFREPLGGLERELAGIGPAIQGAALSGGLLDEEGVDALVQEARTAHDRVQDAAFHELHRDPYNNEMAESILARVPSDLEELNEEVVAAACERLGLNCERQRGDAIYSIEFGNRATVGSLQGVPGGSNFLGSFDRVEALEDDRIDFLAAGHPIVEGILAYLEEGWHGRAALLHTTSRGEVPPGFGLLAIVKDGPRFRPVAVDLGGKERPEWAGFVTRRPLRSRSVRPEIWVQQSGWANRIRSLGRKLERHGAPVALAAFLIEQSTRKTAQGS